MCQSSAALPTFPTLGIYSALCHEDLNFKKGVLQLEGAQTGNKKGEGGKGQEVSVLCRGVGVVSCRRSLVQELCLLADIL